jgi:hypothetical protein
MCTMTSTISPWSAQPVKIGTRMRCPDDDIGKNSVMPWMMASTRICSMGIAGFLKAGGRIDPSGTGGGVL